MLHNFLFSVWFCFYWQMQLVFICSLLCNPSFFELLHLHKLQCQWFLLLFLFVTHRFSLCHPSGFTAFYIVINYIVILRITKSILEFYCLGFLWIFFLIVLLFFFFHLLLCLLLISTSIFNSFSLSLLMISWLGGSISTVISHFHI